MSNDTKNMKMINTATTGINNMSLPKYAEINNMNKGMNNNVNNMNMGMNYNMNMGMNYNLYNMYNMNMGMNYNMYNMYNMNMGMGMNYNMYNMNMGMGMNNNNMNIGMNNNLNNINIGMGNMNNIIDNEDKDGWELTFKYVDGNDEKEVTIHISCDKTVNEAINKYKLKIVNTEDMKFEFPPNKELNRSLKISQSGLSNKSVIHVKPRKDISKKEKEAKISKEKKESEYMDEEEEKIFMQRDGRRRSNAIIPKIK